MQKIMGKEIPLDLLPRILAQLSVTPPYTYSGKGLCMILLYSSKSKGTSVPMIFSHSASLNHQIFAPTIEFCTLLLL